MFSFRRAGFAMLSVSVIATATTIIPNTASASVIPNVGMTNNSFCGTVHNNAWKRQYESNGTPQNVYANVFGSEVQSEPTVCLSDVSSHSSGFEISNSNVSDGYGAYPNIGQGNEWGVRPSGTWSPFKVADDGTPVANVSTNSLSVSGVFNSAFDIWLNKTNDSTVGQNDGAEIMVWLDCHSNCIGYRPITIDGIQWLYTSHVAHNRSTGTSWEYIAFVARHHRDSVSSLWINPFIRYAQRQELVSSSWWLTAIDYGFELVDDGTGLKIASYALSDVGPVIKKPVKKPVKPKPVKPKPVKKTTVQHDCWYLSIKSSYKASCHIVRTVQKISYRP